MRVNDIDKKIQNFWKYKLVKKNETMNFRISWELEFRIYGQKAGIFFWGVYLKEEDTVWFYQW